MPRVASNCGAGASGVKGVAAEEQFTPRVSVSGSPDNIRRTVTLVKSEEWGAVRVCGFASWTVSALFMIFYFWR